MDDLIKGAGLLAIFIFCFTWGEIIQNLTIIADSLKLIAEHMK